VVFVNQQDEQMENLLLAQAYNLHPSNQTLPPVGVVHASPAHHHHPGALAAAAAVAADPLKLAGQSSAVGLNKPRSSSIAGVQFNAQLSLAQQTAPGTSAPMARGGAKSSLVKQASLTKQHFDINDLASFQQELAAASEAKKKMSLQHQNDTTESADEL